MREVNLSHPIAPNVIAIRWNGQKKFNYYPYEDQLTTLVGVEDSGPNNVVVYFQHKDNSIWEWHCCCTENDSQVVPKKLFTPNNKTRLYWSSEDQCFINLQPTDSTRWSPSFVEIIGLS